MEEQCKDTRESARILGVKPVTMAKWRREGRGPAYVRLGRRIVYKVSALYRHLEANTVVPGGSK